RVSKQSSVMIFERFLVAQLDHLPCRCLCLSWAISLYLASDGSSGREDWARAQRSSRDLSERLLPLLPRDIYLPPSLSRCLRYRYFSARQLFLLFKSSFFLSSLPSSSPF